MWSVVNSLCAIILVFYLLDKSTVLGASVIKLEEGTTYQYSLDGHTETSLPKAKGPHGESVKLNIKAKVDVSALPQGKAVIKLKNVQIVGPDNKKHGSLEKLEQQPLVVKVTNGRLDSDIKVAPDDDYTSLNIKRSIASLLQVSLDASGTVDEVDVFGGCPTNYRVSNEGDVTVVTKTRNLNRCWYREELRQDLFAVSHAHSNDFQSTPLLDSDFESEQKVKGGVLESATVKENYLFKPFANRDNGAKTKIVTKLTLDSKSKSAAPASAANTETRSIIFENPHEIVTSTKQTVLAALHKAVDNVADAVKATAAKDFGALVHVVRHASKNDLLSIYGDAKAGAGFKNKQVAKKVFRDALFRAKSADSVAVAVELLKNREIEGPSAKIWYLSFGFVRHSSAASLAAATSLLDEPELPREAYLGVGALAGQYCREHSCDKVPELDALLSKLSKGIENPAQLTKEKENKAIAALKGLKNVRRLNDETAGKVAKVVKEVNAPTRVRAAALETVQADPCREKTRKAAIDVLNDIEEDSELRIKAFLALVECPDAKSANKLSELLEKEPVNQVGTFITSYLRNLRASANPDKEAAKAFLGNVKSKKKFPIDMRKFSHNHEFSYNIEALSTSAAVESNVIFSQKSYLPRSANLNLTTEVFGHAFNLFELSGRAENLERVVERYLGPKGYFRTHKPEEIIKDGQEQAQKLKSRIDEKYKNLVRNRRSVTRQQTDGFASKVKLHKNEQDNNIDVDLSLKVLGNELIWVNLDESKTPVTANAVIDQIAAALERGFGNVKDFSHDVKNHLHFLDSELSYPTATGFPLRLGATGSSVAHLKLAGSLDPSKLLKDPKNGEAKFEIIPSASVEVVGELTIDAYAVEAGLKVSANLHTATGSEITIKLLDGHGVDLNIGLPVKESDILTVNTEVLAVVKERGHAAVDTPLEFQVPRKDFHGCFDQLQPLIGLTACGDLGFPFDQQPLISNAALYPLNGHSKVSLRLNKDDESLKSYHLKFYFNVENPKDRRLEIKIDTPGSKIPRELSFLAAAVTEPNRAVTVQLISPIYKLGVEGKIIDNDSEYSLSGALNLNDEISYKARLGILINGATYTPVLEYTPVGSNAVNVKVEGTVTVDKKAGYRKYTFNTVKITSPKSVYTVDGTIIRDTNLFQTDLKLGYDGNTVGVKTKLQRVGEKNLKINAEISPSQFPDFGFGLKYEYQRDDKHLENSLVLVHGPDLNSKTHKISLFQQTHYKIESAQNFDISTKNTLSYPLFEVEGKLEGAVTKKSLVIEVEAGYAKMKAKSKLSAKTAINKPGDYEIDFLASALEHEVKLEAKRDVVDTDKSKFSNKLTLTPGGSYEVNADVTHRVSPNDVNVQVVAVAKVHSVAKDYKIDGGVISNANLFDGHAKIIVGGDEYIDSAVKVVRSPNPSGNFKLNLRNVVNSHGEYKLEKTKASGLVLIHILGLNRKLKGTADLSITGSKHAGSIDIFFDADKDNNKKLHIETDTDLTKTSIKSKNKVKLLDRQVEVNFNGELQGKSNNGGTTGALEVILPNGRVIVGKLKEVLQLVPANSNAELFVELGTAEKKGDPLFKFYLDTYAKNVDTKRYAIDGKFEIGHECPELTAKIVNTIKTGSEDGKLKIKGSQEYIYKDKKLVLQAEAELQKKEGGVKLSVTLPDSKTCQSELKYKHDASEDDRKAQVSLTASHDNNNVLKLEFKTDYKRDLSVINGQLTGETPLKAIKTIDIQVTQKRLSPVSASTDVKLVLNGEKIEGSAKIDVTPNHPVIDLTVIHSAGKSRLYYKFDKKSDRQATSEGQLAWTSNGGGVYDFSTNVDLESYDNFVITIKANSEKLNVNKLKFEVGNRPTKGGGAKRINFSAQTADKKGFSGSVSYAVKETDVGFTIDGKGQINIYNENHPISYKGEFKKLSKGVDKEEGHSFKLNADFGKGSLLIDQKLSDKEYHYNAKYCKESNCANLEILSKFQYIDIASSTVLGSLNYENNLDGKSHAFKVSTKTHRKGLFVDHETVLKLKDKSYIVKSYVHEEDAAITIEIPTREIAAIVTYDLPLIGKSKSNPNTLTYRIDGSLYLDKKKNPTDKTTVTILGDLTTLPKAVSVNGEVKFSHPSLQKELSVKSKGTVGLEKRLIDASVEVDVFSKKNQRIAISVKLDHDKTPAGHNVTGKLDIISKGLVLDIGANGHVFASKDSFSAGSFGYYVDDKNIRKDAGVFVEANPTRLFGVVKVPNKELFRIDAKVQATRDKQVVDAEYSIAELRTSVAKLEVDGWSAAKVTFSRKDTPNKKLVGTAGITGKQLEVRAETVDGATKENLFFLTLKVEDGKAIKPNYEINTEKLKKLIDHVKSDSNQLITQLKTLLSELTKELSRELTALLESLKKAQPNLKPYLQQYQTHLDAIRKELNDDPEFKKLSEAVKTLLSTVLKSLEQAIALYERILKELGEAQEKLLESYRKILPNVIQSYEKILEALSALASRLTEYATAILSQALEIIRQNEADIRQVLTNLSENFEDVTRLAVSTITQLRHEIEDFIKIVIDQVRSLPMYTALQERYEELKGFELPQQFWNLYSEVAFAVEDFLPTPELKELVRSIFSYVEKLLKRQEVNDASTIKGISELTIKALKSIAELIKQQYTSDDASGILGIGLKFPLPGRDFWRLPQAVDLQNCLLVRFLRVFNELPSGADYFYTYRPTLNPLDYVPPYKAYATILNSHHFFTFDRQHFAFKGTCSYVLAQDFQDGNFSIIANLDNGKLRSITVNDRTDSVDILGDNTVKVNGKLGDYPVNQNEFNGWTRYGRVNLKHKAGIHIIKDRHRDLYIIKVSGFYFGRTRGLLGTINNEQYDEFTLPNGHIAKDAAEFANAYKVTDSCASVPDLKSSGVRAAECTQFFTSESSIRSGFHYVNPEIYREACDQHVAMAGADKAKAACEVVLAYVTALKLEKVPFAALPSECAKCTVEGKPVELGYSATIQSPKGKADVIIVLEQSTFNSPVFKELVTPLITTLSHDLKEKGLGDAEFVLIGFGGPNQKWPAIYGNNGKITYEGKADNIVFGDTEPLTPPYDTLGKKIKYVAKFLSVELGTEQIVYAMNEANIYPFRQGAAKIIVLINSTPCSKSPIFPVSLQVPRIFSIRKFYKDHGLQFHIVSPLAGLTLTNKPEQKLKNVVGFDSEKIYTLADAKKKPVEGEAADRPTLKYEDDLCLAFSQYYGGAAFSSQNFVDSKPEQKKKFVQVVSQRIVQGAIAHEYSEDCTCRLYDGVYRYPECKVISKEQKGR